MREETTSRVTAADRPYGEFYDFYSVSPEKFGSTHIYISYQFWLEKDHLIITEIKIVQ